MLDVIKNGTTLTGYDGKPLFADDHSGGDNLLGGTGTTVANLQADISAVFAAMREFQDDRGRVMNIVPDLVVVPAELEFPMRQALKAGQIDGTDNVYAGLCDVMVAPELTDADDWYAFATNRAMTALSPGAKNRSSADTAELHNFIPGNAYGTPDARGGI